MRVKVLHGLLIFVCFPVFSQTGNTNAGTEAGSAGSYNTSIGYYAGNAISGSSNTMLGANSGKILTGTNHYNTFLGANSGFNTNGSLITDNLFGGYNSGYDNTTGKHNVFLGSNAGYGSTIGNHNTSVGSYAVGGGGNMNTFLGYFSGTNGGSYNVMIGGNTSGGGGSASIGSNNTIIGTYSGYNAVGTGNIFIGYRSAYNETNSNRLYIENSDSSIPLIYGDFSTDKVGINSLPSSGILTPNANVALTVGGMINSTGLLVNGVPISGDLSFWGRSGNYVSALTTADNVGIGVILTEAKNVRGYKLAVNGKIGAKEVEIENTSITWSDFVFADDYKLLSLEEVEKFIKANKHLPEIPSEKEVKENGILLGEMNAKLLQKIEELTLYVIELKKDNEKLKRKCDEIEIKLQQN